MERIICLVIGYACGLLQSGYLVGKMHHIDIRKAGSGNSGSTNALRVMGLKAGLMTFAGDVLKCFAAVLIVRAIYHGSNILPLLMMYAGAGVTLGHNFRPANIHAGGLRYHGAGVIVSQLLKDKLMEAVDIPQLETFEAGILFAKSEGIIPAPESCHAIAATIREAKKCIETGEEKVILFNLSGHGLIDMTAYDQYLSGNLNNYTLSDEEINHNLEDVPQVKMD